MSRNRRQQESEDTKKQKRHRTFAFISLPGNENSIGLSLAAANVPHMKSESSWEQKFLLALDRVARCPVFDRTVRFFGDLSGQKYDAKPDN